MSTLFPEVKDLSGLGAKYTQPFIFNTAVEGQADNAGSATVGVVYTIARPSDSDSIFGPVSSLGSLVKFLLGRGVAPVYAAASAKGTTPTLAQRQAVWQTLEAMRNIYIRMTDDVTQATLVALAASCANAALIFNKQVAFGGMAAGTTKAALISAAQAIASKKFVFVGPGILDSNNVLLSGNYGAAAVAAAVATNPDISDDLDLAILPNLNGIELGANGQPLFFEHVVGGTAVNDFEDLLQGGVSPLMTDPSGNGLAITHLRTTYTTDTTYDALETRLIIDEIFNEVRQYCLDNNFLRRGNNDNTRNDLRAGIESILQERSSWITPVTLPDGSTGYGVSIIPSTDLRSVTIQYQGVVQRGIQTINVDAQLTIPV